MPRLLPEDVGQNVSIEDGWPNGKNADTAEVQKNAANLPRSVIGRLEFPHSREMILSTRSDGILIDWADTLVTVSHSIALNK